MNFSFSGFYNVAFFKKAIFSFLLFSFTFGNSFSIIFAQTATTPTTNFQYEVDGNNLKKAAQEQCSKILEGKGIEGVYASQSVDVKSLTSDLPPITLGNGSGGSTVPTIDQALISVTRGVFQSSEKGNELLNKSLGELRRLNLGLFCVQATKLAEATEAVKKNITKVLQADEKYKLKRPWLILEEINKEVCKEFINNKEGNTSEQTQAMATYCTSITSSPKPAPARDVKIADSIIKNGPNSIAEMLSVRPNSYEETAREMKQYIDQRISEKKSIINNDVEKYGVIGLYLCTKTYSGSDPAKVDWYKADCKEWVQEMPAALVLAQNEKVVNAPLEITTASVLGEDKEITNITNRLYSGVAGEAPWDQQGIYSNFAQSSGGNPYFPNVNTGGGGNNLGITTGVGTNGGTSINEIKSASQTKDELLKNLNITIAMYNLAKTYYASTTSPCAVLPLAKRVETIAKIEEAKAPIEKRKADIEKRWAEVLANPTADHSKFFLQMSADLGQTINQEFVKKVYTAVAALLKVCADAKAGITTTTNTNSNGVNVNSVTF